MIDAVDVLDVKGEKNRSASLITHSLTPAPPSHQLLVLVSEIPDPN